MTDDHAICNPAGSCCTPKVNDDAIREAAVEAVDGPGSLYLLQRGVLDEADLLRIIDAVRPLIEADLRTRLAKAIEAHADRDGMTGLYRLALADAARIVRERP